MREKGNEKGFLALLNEALLGLIKCGANGKSEDVVLTIDFCCLMRFYIKTHNSYAIKR